MNVFSIIVLSTLSWSNPEIDTTHIHSEVQLECQIEEHLIDTLISTGKQLLGTPYKYAGNTEKGIDCSVLPAYLYGVPDRKSTRLNSSHVRISYAVFCL